jgi:DNA-binding FadR family transcriptional regulator
VCARLGWSETALEEVLEALEQAGMVERLESDDTDLDFTGAFSAARFAAGKKTS